MDHMVEALHAWPGAKAAAAAVGGGAGAGTGASATTEPAAATHTHGADGAMIGRAHADGADCGLHPRRARRVAISRHKNSLLTQPDGPVCVWSRVWSLCCL